MPLVLRISLLLLHVLILIELTRYAFWFHVLRACQAALEIVRWVVERDAGTGKRIRQSIRQPIIM